MDLNSSSDELATTPSQPIENIVIDPVTKHATWLQEPRIMATYKVHLFGPSVTDPYYILVRILEGGFWDCQGIPQHLFTQLMFAQGYTGEQIDTFTLATMSVISLQQLTELYNRLGVMKRDTIDKAMDRVGPFIGKVINRTNHQSSPKI